MSSTRCLLRSSPRRAALVALAALAAPLAACDAQPDAPARALPTAAHVEVPRGAPLLACAASRDVDGADVVARAGDRLYYLSAQSGLVVLDARDPSEPRPIGRAPIAGTPVSVVVRGGVAVVVVADWSDPAGSFYGSLVRAYDVRRDGAPVAIAEARLAGKARDARGVDDVLFVVHETGTEVALASFTLEAGLAPRAERRFRGTDAALTATPTRLALAYRAGERRTALVTFDLGLRATGDLAAGKTTLVRGALPPATSDFGSATALALDEDTARVLTCATSACAAGDALLLSTIDLTGARGEAAASAPTGEARLASELPIPPSGGPLVARFAGARLYVAGTRHVAEGLGPTTIRAIDVADPLRPRPAGAVRVASVVTNLVPQAGRLLAVGTLTTPEAGMRVVLQEIEPDAMRVARTVFLGDPSTWTPLQRDVRAAASDDAILAFPITSWDGQTNRYENALEVVRAAGAPPIAPVRLPAPGWIDRVLLDRDRLIVLGDFGARSVATAALGAPHSEAPARETP